MTKIKVLDLDELFNFVVDDFFNWNHLVFENVVWSCHIFKFKFKLFKKCYIEKISKIKVIDLDKLYHFVVNDISIWNHLLFENVVWSCHNLKFKFKTVQTKSYRKMTKTKVVDIDDLYNFVVDDFFSWNHLVFENIVWSCHIFKFKFKRFKKCYIEKWPK